MNRQSYDRYLERFNARDYEGVLSYYAPQFEISFAGYTLRTREAVLSFYGFLHQYVRESIVIDAFVSNDEMIAMEARVRLEGIRELTPAAARAAGFERLMVPRVGEVLEIPQFIHYHLRGGKIVKALCAVFGP
jgi:hypothetical protein